ncbi:class I SAM-dependent methyltransferase [Lentzea sp. NEAU-D13]|uniref:Class I SAM-dependent methyltransferase n=1 Tax=Lentzea alba TaxID=2714351 RepID=A0A7C9RUT7_9PSEU|nr:class I SAM-dependent methyltransferase [Lentzea alba]NGY63304.1 class I SAM-dependent methyltransferase [Lentzea alba]
MNLPIVLPRVFGRRSASLTYLDEVSVAAMVSALELEPGARASLDVTARALRIAPRHEWLVLRWLRTLALRGVIEFDGRGYRVLGEVRRLRPEDLSSSYRRLRIPRNAARLHERAVRRLPELLRDEVTAGALLAPDGSACAALAGEGLSSCTDELDEDCAQLVGSGALVRRRAVRVVEIGGGTGRTTDALLDVLPSAIACYRFTDVCEEVLWAVVRARPELRAEILDVNQDFADQGFADASADVVVAGHSLHHATNIGRALMRIHRLLVPGGELVFSVPAGDDPAALVSTHFLHSPVPGGEVLRGGQIFPDGGVWESALRAAGFALKVSMSAGARSSVRHHLFHAVREAV